MAKPVAVVADTAHGEITPSSLECVEEARDVAAGLSAAVHVFLVGHDVASLTHALAEHGADRITVIEHEALAQFSADGWLAALAPHLRKAAPALILAPDTGHGRSWLPRLSARWRAPLVTNAIRAQVIADGYPEAYRISHEGKLYERLVWARGTLVMLMLAPGVRGIGAPRGGRQVQTEIVQPTLDPDTFRDRTLRTLPPDPQVVDLSEAERIVSGGLGVGSADGMAQLQHLADALGAALGGSRVVADRGWLAHDRFIGTTGKIVAPKLYMAFGVSGAGQHVAGIAGSETIIAINTDPTSPMLKMADLGIVGDLNQIVPILLRKLKEMATREGHDAAAPAEETSLAVRAAAH